MKKSYIKLISKVLLTGITSVVLVSQFACHNTSSSPAPSTPVANPITNTSLSGFITGTLLTGTTYTLYGDVYIKNTDSLIVQPGVTVLAHVNGDPNSSTFTSYAIHCSGTLKVEGTQSQPVVFKPDVSNPQWPNGYWGGIQCDSNCKYVSLQYAKISYTGGADIAGGAQYAFSVQGKSNSNTICIVENCKFLSGIDDCIRLMGPIKVSIKGNVIMHQGSNDGDNINIKTGVTGDVAYNYIWSAANNSIKLNTNSLVLIPQTKVNIYNNTLISGGWRKQGEITAGILIDTWAAGSAYNNLVINCHAGVRITSAADDKNVKYGNNYFYTSALNGFPQLDSTRANYYPATDWAKATSSDFLSTKSSDVNGVIKALNVALSEFSTDQSPLVPMDLNDPHLATGSPVIGKGNTSAPYTSGLGTTMLPGKDIGAYQSDGTGNQIPTGW